MLWENDAHPLIINWSLIFSAPTRSHAKLCTLVFLHTVAWLRDLSCGNSYGFPRRSWLRCKRRSQLVQSFPRALLNRRPLAPLARSALSALSALPSIRARCARGRLPPASVPCFRPAAVCFSSCGSSWRHLVVRSVPVSQALYRKQPEIKVS